jgi:hypothetical protein
MMENISFVPQDDKKIVFKHVMVIGKHEAMTGEKRLKE